METRSLEVRATDKRTLEGIAVVFNQPARIDRVTEIIHPDALRGVDLDGIVLITNHDGSGIPLARSPKTLELSVTDKGLEMRASLPDTEGGI